MCHLCLFKTGTTPITVVLSYLSWQQLQAFNVVTIVTGELVSCATAASV